MLVVLANNEVPICCLHIKDTQKLLSFYDSKQSFMFGKGKTSLVVTLIKALNLSFFLTRIEDEGQSDEDFTILPVSNIFLTVLFLLFQSIRVFFVFCLTVLASPVSIRCFISSLNELVSNSFFANTS